MKLPSKARTCIGKIFLSECLVHNALVDRLDTNKTKHYNGTCRKNFKEHYNNTQHLLEIKAKKKALNSQNATWS